MACSSEGATERRLNQYNKILKMDLIVSELCKFGKVNLLNETCGTIPVGNFNDVVDLNNIHMWLSHHTNVVEYRLAYTVTSLLNQNISFDKIKEILYEAGKKIAYNGPDYLDRIFSYIDLNYLDGMPCDDTKEIVCMTEECIEWKRKMDLHSKFWVMAHGDAKNYFDLMSSYINGILCKVDVHFESKQNNICCLVK